MSNRAKDMNITLGGDIATILREHVVDECRTPDEWCVICGVWPCPPVVVAMALQRVLQTIKDVHNVN